MRPFGYKYAAPALLFFIGAAASVQAQHVSGTTRDATSRAPIAGVVVALLDSASHTIARTISSADGQYRLIGNGSAVSVRALRIGFRPIDHVLATTAVDASIAVDLDMATLPMLLDTVAVQSQSRCPARADGQTAFALWNAARSALLASVVAREANPSNLRVLLFDRGYQGRTERIQQLFVADTVFTAAQAMVSVRSGADYQTLGFMDSDSTQLHQKFYLPVAEVLLDSSFVEGHCLSVRNDPAHHADDVGLAFAPAPRKDSLVDVEGVIWISRNNPELRSLEFTYTQMPSNEAQAKPGGTLEFRTLPNGVVMPTRWYAHIPELARVPVRLGSRVVGTARSMVATHDIGGELAEASWPDGSVWRDTLGAVRGQVVIEGTGQPIPNAFVHLLGTTFRTNADSAGNFSFPTTIRGPYRVEAVDTAFTALGVVPRATTEVTVGSQGFASARVEIQSRAKSVKEACAASMKESGAATGGDYVLVGRVNLKNGAPARDASVNVQWPNSSAASKDLVRGSARTDSLGRFEFCGVPVGIDLRLNAARDSLVSPEVHITLDTARHLAQAALTLTRLDLANLPAYRTRHIVVTDAFAFTPLSDVEIVDALDGALIGKTDTRGSMTLAAIPEGRTFVRLRKLGYEQHIEIINIERGEIREVRALLRNVQQLATVKVTAAAAVSRLALNDGFEDRVKVGIGHFLFPKDFDRERDRSISLLVTRMGIHLVPRGSSTVMSGGHGNTGYCPVNIYIDGVLWSRTIGNEPPPNVYNFLASDYAAAEYYAGPSEYPPQYGGTMANSCGLLVLWRRES